MTTIQSYFAKISQCNIKLSHFIILNLHFTSFFLTLIAMSVNSPTCNNNNHNLSALFTLYRDKASYHDMKPLRIYRDTLCHIVIYRDMSKIPPFLFFNGFWCGSYESSYHFFIYWGQVSNIFRKQSWKVTKWPNINLNIELFLKKLLLGFAFFYSSEKKWVKPFVISSICV